MSTGDYVLGIAGLAAIAVSLALAARALRRRLMPGWTATPALLADAVLAIALFVAVSELLGLVGLLEGPILVAACLVAALAALAASPAPGGAGRGTLRAAFPARPVELAVAIALGLLVVAQWAVPTLVALDRGLYGGDSLWYHMPFAAHIAQSGSVTELLFTDPLYLNWFYPQVSELLHAGGLLLLGNDFLSPLVNLGWLALALLAGYCCGRPHGAGPVTLAAVAALMAVDLLSSRQPGNANNDVVAIALLLSSIALLLNTRWEAAEGGSGAAAPPLRAPLVRDQIRAPSGRGTPPGPPYGALFVAGLAAGLALGTKLTVVVPVAALTLGVILVAAAGTRARVAGLWAGALALGGGYWYLRNLIVAGNPLPWLDLGPLDKSEELQGRDEFSIADYLTDRDVWDDYFVPGLEERFGDLWPLLLILAAAGVLLAVAGRGRVERMLAAVAAIGAIAYFLTPLSASGPEGMPVGFRLNIRYLAPALAIALVLVALPPPRLRTRAPWWRWGALIAFAALIVLSAEAPDALEGDRALGTVVLVVAFAGAPLAALLLARRRVPVGAIGAALAAGALGLAVLGSEAKNDYLQQRYALSAPDYPRDEHPSIELGLGLGAGYDWARGTGDARVALSGSLGALFGYGLWGNEATNEVRFLGERRDRGAFVALDQCPEWIGAVNGGDYDYVVTTPGYDQDDPGASKAPIERQWISRARSAERIAGAELVDVWRLHGTLDPIVCAPPPAANARK
jgi:hypothetical protein